MFLSATKQSFINTRPLPILLLAWFILNLIQAALSPLDADESYYWMYAGELAWGYFDHPPVVAVLVKIGMDWIPGELGVRLGHVLASTAAIAGMWFLLERPKGPGLWLAVALVFAQPFLHVYGFIATPDGPLLLFAVLYLLAFRRFLHTPSVINGALWGVTMAGLLYSKYHGLILILFSVLPHLFWLLRQPGAWVAALGGAALYAPHLYWQYANDYPSFRYHLNGRNDAYRLRHTTQYLLNQLLIFSPLLLWFYGKTLYHFKSLIRGTSGARTQVTITDPFGVHSRDDKARRADQAFLKTNYWLIVGFFLFFLYSTSKGGTEAQWTAVLSVPLCYLTFRAVRDYQPEWGPMVKRLGFLTIGVILLGRLFLMAPREWVPFAKPFDHQPWVERVEKQANGLPVMVQNSYRYASLYQFYSGKPAWTFTDVQYRQSQYDLWQTDSVYHNQPLLLLAQKSWDTEDAIVARTDRHEVLLARIDSFQVMKGLTLAPATPLPDTISRSSSPPFQLLGEVPRALHLNAGQLPSYPMITIYYSAEEKRFWKLRGGKAFTTIPKGSDVPVFKGQLSLYNNVPLGRAEIEFGMGYQGMPPLRGQSARYPVFIIE